MAVKERVGLVVSDKMDKTVVVAVENRAPHPKYRKIVVQTKRYKVHDEENRCQVGDRVRIRETRPLSRTKRWTVIGILGETASEEVASASEVQQPAPSEQPSAEPVNQSSEPDEQGEEQ
jgi:small subunit ribosomal protein S17